MTIREMSKTVAAKKCNIRRVKMSAGSVYVRFVIALVLVPWTLMAQQSSTSGTDPQPGEVVRGGYVIHQSIEAGYRFQDQTGSEAMYGTLVDLHQGPRILEQTLSMQAEKNQGVLFDNLWISSFGW